MDEEAKPNETMHGGRLSATEKGKQKVADADCADLAPALVLQSAGQLRPAAMDAAAANWHAGGVPRHLLLGTPCGGTSEIEEAPPSPPPAPSSRPHQLPALTNAAVAGLQGRLMEMQAALLSRLRELEHLRRLRESGGGFKDDDAEADKLRRREGAAADEPEPEPEEVKMLQSHLGTMQAKVSGMKDAMLAFRLQAEEMQALEDFWKPVVPPERQQPQRNSSKAELEQMKALEEFWKPVVPVPQRNNNNKRKINWKRIISLIALTSWLVHYISIWTLLPVNLTHIVGAISVLWILRSTYSCCQRFRTSRTISRHVPRLICVCFWLVVLYVVYLILRLIHGAFAGLLGKHQ